MSRCLVLAGGVLQVCGLVLIAVQVRRTRRQFEEWFGSQARITRLLAIALELVVAVVGGTRERIGVRNLELVLWMKMS